MINICWKISYHIIENIFHLENSHIISVMIIKCSKLSYHIIDDNIKFKIIISYRWWYFSRQNYHIVSSMIFIWQKSSYYIDWPNQLSANTAKDWFGISQHFLHFFRKKLGFEYECYITLKTEACHYDQLSRACGFTKFCFFSCRSLFIYLYVLSNLFYSSNSY